MPTLRMRTKVLPVLTALLLSSVIGLSARSWAIAPVPWLYEVAVPVASQASAERITGSAAALLIMLQRLTGLAYVPHSPEVRAALANADSYYNEFRFNRLGESMELVVQFDAAAVLDLVKRANLPIWRSAREQVVAWVVIESDGARRIVSATSAEPVVAAMIGRAAERGLPLTLPLLDLEDQLAASPAAVWGRLSRVLERASKRYGADVILVGRASPLAGGDWNSSWEIWLPNRVVPWSSAEADLTFQAASVVDLLADELASRNVVFGRGATPVSAAVSGIGTPLDFSSLLTYLRSLEIIDAVEVVHLARNRVDLLLTTRADADQLAALFTADRRLFVSREVGLIVSPPVALQLEWRTR